METVEQLAERYFETSWNKDGLDARKAYSAGYEAAAPKWISAKERMPELSKLILLYKKGYPLIVGYVDREDDEHGAVYWVKHEEYMSFPYEFFTHWQELPSAPGGAE